MKGGAKVHDDPNAQRVLQRIRNRVIEYLELASSLELQLRYQTSAPVVVAHEVINQWEDIVSVPVEDLFEPPVFSPEELDAARSFHEVWRSVADGTPSELPAVEVVSQWPEWQRLRHAAETAHGVFARRGLWPESTELT